jgi:hypothetical protein
MVRVGLQHLIHTWPPGLKEQELIHDWKNSTCLELSRRLDSGLSTSRRLLLIRHTRFFKLRRVYEWTKWKFGSGI